MASSKGRVNNDDIDHLKELKVTDLSQQDKEDGDDETGREPNENMEPTAEENEDSNWLGTSINDMRDQIR